MLSVLKRLYTCFVTICWVRRFVIIRLSVWVLPTRVHIHVRCEKQNNFINTFETDKHNSYLGLIENDSAWITSCNVLRSCFQLLNLEFLKGTSSSWRLTYENTHFKYLSVLQIKNCICRCFYTGKAKLNYFFLKNLCPHQEFLPTMCDAASDYVIVLL